MNEEKLEELSDENIALVVTDESEDYIGVNEKILNYLIEEENRSGIYVTVNKPYEELFDELKQDGVDTDQIFFMDAVSKESSMETPDEDNVMFLDSPEDLTGLSIVISEGLGAIGGGDKFMLLDSLTTLKIYNEMETVTKFAHYLTSKLRSHENVSGIVLSVEAEKDEELISKFSQFCDCVVRI